MGANTALLPQALKHVNVEARSISKAPGSVWRSASFFALLGLSATAFAAPEISLRRATEHARECVAKVEAPRAASLPDCSPILREFEWSASINYTEHDSTYRIEELRGRIAMNRYLSSMVGNPNADERADAALAVKEAQQMMDAGSQRVSLEQLGPPVLAPHMGKLASLYGDRLTLIDHFEYYGLWHTRRDAIEAALLEAEFDEVDRIAHQLSEWRVREADLRSAAGAALCITAPSEGLALLSTIPETRAEKRYANIQRNYGEVFAATKACAAKAGAPPPEKPDSYGAGILDAQPQNALTDIRLAQSRRELDRALDAALSALSVSEAMPPRARAFLLAAVLTHLPAPPRREDVLTWAQPASGETAFAPEVLRVGALLAEGPALNPTLPTEWLERACAQLDAMAGSEQAPEEKKLLLQLAGGLHLQTAAEHARNGSVDAAERHATLGGERLSSSPKAKALSIASALYVAGAAGRAQAVLESSAQEEEKNPRLEQAWTTLQVLLLARSGKTEQAQTLAKTLASMTSELFNAKPGQVPPTLDELDLEAAWTALAVSPESVAKFDLPNPPAPVWQGLADSQRRHLSRGAPFIRAELGAWQRALAADDGQRRAFRYQLMNTRGDMLALGIPLMFAGGKLLANDADPSAVEVWLDALTTIDSRRIRLRSYAFMRMEAAALRGDKLHEQLWAERLSVLRKVASQTDDLEVARLLRL